jgi:hypothetical protein
MFQHQTEAATLKELLPADAIFGPVADYASIAPLGPPGLLYEELLHRFAPSAVLDMSCIDSCFAAVCINKGTSYVGCCQSGKHAVAVQGQLRSAVFKSMLAEGTHTFKKDL